MHLDPTYRRFICGDCCFSVFIFNMTPGESNQSNLCIKLIALTCVQVHVYKHMYIIQCCNGYIHEAFYGKSPSGQLGKELVQKVMESETQLRETGGLTVRKLSQEG